MKSQCIKRNEPMTIWDLIQHEAICPDCNGENKMSERITEYRIRALYDSCTLRITYVEPQGE